MSVKYIKIQCIEVNQPIGTFYIGSIDHKDLLGISYADVRRIEERDVEKYLGIQRPLSEGRVAELKQYVETIDASFPTSIILAVNSFDEDNEDIENIIFDEDNNLLKIRRDEKVAKIIDGQHRIAGLREYKGDNFKLNVTIFVDMDIEDQAMVFATINLKQTKVTKSLMYDLYDFTTARSPQKTCHNIAKLLNNKDDSPFRNKIKILGKATGKKEESLTQAAFVDRLIKYISRNPMLDRDLLKRGKKLKKIVGKEAKSFIFKNLFIDEKDADIAKNIWNYFKAVEQKWGEAWIETKPGNILNRTTGFGALMRFLRNVYNSFEKPETVISFDEYYSIFNNIDLKDEDFNPDNYKPGSSGEGALFRELLDKSGLNEI